MRFEIRWLKLSLAFAAATIAAYCLSGLATAQQPASPGDAAAPAGAEAAPAAAEPPDDPPGTSGAFEPCRRHGECTGPKAEVSFDEPMANSSLLVLPSNTAPSRHRFAVTVDS